MKEIQNPSDRKLQFSLRGLLLCTAVLAIDFGFIARARGNMAIMLFLLMTQAGLLFISWMYYNFLHATTSSGVRVRRGGLYQGLAAAGTIYGGVLFTALFTLGESNSNATTTSEPMTFEQVQQMLCACPLWVVAIATVGTFCAVSTGMAIDFFAFIFASAHLEQISQTTQTTMIGALTGLIAPSLFLALLSLGSFTQGVDWIYLAAAVVLPMIVGGTVCYLFA